MFAICFVAACGGGSAGHGQKPDASGGTHGDASVKTDARGSVDHPVDAGRPDAAPCGTAASKKAAGQSCTCAADCASKFCVDGVCCNESCSGGCRTCSAPGTAGICTARVTGADPRRPSDCPSSAASTCGLDGKCDGAGSCRDFPVGTMCMSGVCQGAAVVGVGVCDGAGQCRPGPTTICVPFSCDPTTNACFNKCASDNDCVKPHACDGAGSCGKRLLGAPCTGDTDCSSGFCADNVCCNSACKGACVACALPSREGVCWPIEAGAGDPNGVCKDLGAGACGTNGLCDGLGSCALYPLGTQCEAPTCSGDRLNMAATCDGLGTCRSPGLQDCSPFQCVAGGCTGTCNVDADCHTGISCVNHTCGPKLNGQPCGQGSECKSNQCVDGVCCDSACSGSCRSCNLAGTVGKCTNAPSGSGDPRSTCQDAGAASCGTNGKCDGAGSCQLYARNTACAAESCGSNVYTPLSTCDGAGRCVTPDALPCSPYVCNGSKCFNACTADTQCLTPNRCTTNSCGPANNGATCSAGGECKSGFCAQGICCDKSCTGACQSCALSGSLGTCTNVPTGDVDPAGLCKDAGSSSCGTNGKCQAGACQKYASGTSCAKATCGSGTSTFTGTSTCDGAGKCVKPASSSCFPYVCGSAACKASCTANADCASPAVCSNGSCGLKDPGRTCADGTECKSGFCAQGVCCATACNGTCKSCNVSTSTAGTCTNVPSGQNDPQGGCKDQGAASCGNDGVCNGSGACQLYAAGSVCVASSCPAAASTQTNARTCDGAGTCRAATTTACAPYMCNGTTACNAACKVDADCVTGNICDPKTNLCGNKKRQGQTCSASGDCLTGLSCVDGVCCGSTSCGTCKSCNVSGSAGTCANIPSGGAEPHGLCPTSPTAPCGNTGACTGTGACQQAPATVSCGTASCSGSTLTPATQCTGTGSCAMATPASCSPYICGTGACKTSCTKDTDCVAPFTCQGTGTTKSCTLKATGQTCTAGTQCISGNCVDGICCGSASCPACQACNVNGLGTCAGLGAGTTDTRCGGGTTACGKTNSCDGAGACSNSTAMCKTASCSGSLFTPASFCSGAGTTCPVQAATSCGTFACTTAGCNTKCASVSDCAAGSFCDATGNCQSAGGPGAACSGDTQCAAGRCVDGVCCNTTAAACPRCQACNVKGSAGTCTFVGTGAAEPHNLCPPSLTNKCANTGACAADQSCAQAPSTVKCGDPSCAAGTELHATFCDGAGACAPATFRQCDPFVCGPTACKGSCGTDADCITGDYCDVNGNCQTQKTPGATCGSTDECATGVCGAQGVCCDTACGDACMTCTLAASPGTCSPDPTCM